MRRVLFWASLPFVLPQALRIRHTALRLAGASGATSGLIAGELTIRLIAIGDSIVAGVGASTLERALVGRTAAGLAGALDVGVAWECLGSIGATSDKVAQHLVPQLTLEPADFIALSVGVNDITSLTTLAKWQKSLNALLVLLHQHSPGATIAVAGIPPLHYFPLLPQPLRAVLGIRGRAFDSVARQVVAQHSYAVYVPLEFTPGPDNFSPDGFHPSELSYAGLGDAVAVSMIEHANRSGIQKPIQSLRALITA